HERAVRCRVGWAPDHTLILPGAGGGIKVSRSRPSIALESSRDRPHLRSIIRYNDGSYTMAESPHRIGSMLPQRFIMNAGRTSKQGVQINVGKDYAEYQAIVNTLIMHPDDMKAVGVANGGSVRVRNEYGEAVFQCKEGKVPAGMIFVPYGPPTCRLMGG